MHAARITSVGKFKKPLKGGVQTNKYKTEYYKGIMCRTELQHFDRSATRAQHLRSVSGGIISPIARVAGVGIRACRARVAKYLNL